MSVLALSNPVFRLSPPQRRLGTSGEPGEHPGQDHGVRHGRLLPDDPRAHVTGGERHHEQVGHRDKAWLHQPE